MLRLTLGTAISVILLAVVHGGSDFTVKVDTGTGRYQVRVGGVPWLGSGAPGFQAGGRHHTPGDGSLVLGGPGVPDTGRDALGDWSATSFLYTTHPGGINFSTTVRAYSDVNAAVFSQRYEADTKQTSVGNKDGVISRFPSFVFRPSNPPNPSNPSNPDDPDDLGYLHFSGIFIGHERLQIGRVSKMEPLVGGLESGPIVLFDRQDNVMIISSFNNFMAASFVYDNGSVSYGIMGDVDSVPRGYTLDTIVFYSNQGINKAFEDWGALMMRWYNRDSSSRRLDPTINYIGYWTDNGAYYYHHTEEKLNYEKTIELLNLYAQTKGIPYRYLQLDDWFYPIAGTGYGATVTWDAMPSVFPHGLQALYNFTQLPFHVHNRYWSNKTTYAKQNGGQFNFLMDGENSIPDDQEFWDFLFRTSKQWGLTVYEQDWLNWQVHNIKYLHSDLTLGTRWLQQMGQAAANNGIYIQYCMSLSRELLASLEIPAVSQIRVSIDYMLKKEQWTIGITSLFSHVLGVAPFKDNFWTESVQPGNTHKMTEPNPARQAAVAILSTGPVGPSDKVGYSNVDLIKQLHTANGLLLKPSKPATAIDLQIQQEAFGGDVGPRGELWTTYSDVGPYRFGIIFTTELTAPYKLGPKQANFGNKWIGTNVVYTTNRTSGVVTSAQTFSDVSPILLENTTSGGTNFTLHYTAPVFTFQNTPVYLAGELTKIVPVSPGRISSVSVSSRDVRVTVRGTPGERTTLSFCTASPGHLTSCTGISCVISPSGDATTSLRDDYRKWSPKPGN